MKVLPEEPKPIPAGTIDQQFGLWQLCPKCDGEGVVPAIGTSGTGLRDCPVCNGTKLLVRPEIKSL